MVWVGEAEFVLVGSKLGNKRIGGNQGLEPLRILPCCLRHSFVMKLHFSESNCLMLGHSDFWFIYIYSSPLVTVSHLIPET